MKLQRNFYTETIEVSGLSSIAFFEAGEHIKANDFIGKIEKRLLH